MKSESLSSLLMNDPSDKVFISQDQDDLGEEVKPLRTVKNVPNLRSNRNVISVSKKLRKGNSSQYKNTTVAIQF